MLCINAYRINLWKTGIKRPFVYFGKENHDGVGTPLDICQKNDVKNMALLKR